MAADYFLQIPDIPGESKDKDHTEWIEILSLNFGFQNPTTLGSLGSGAGAGKAVASELVVLKAFDKASPKLMQMLFTGDHKNGVKLNVRKASGDKASGDFLKLVLDTVFVTQIEESASAGGDDVPIEQVTFLYGKLSLDYSPQKADGTLDTPIHAGWDFIQNKGN